MVHNDSQNKTRLIGKRIIKLLIGCAIAIPLAYGCFIAGFTLILSMEDIEDWFEVRATSRKLPEAEIRYNAIIEQITGITEDDVLKENIYSLRVPKQHYFTHCIRGGTYWIYGANRPFEEVVSDYADAFTQMGWEYIVIRENTHYFKAETGRVRLEAVSPGYSSHSDQYQTTYEIDFSYAEPSRGGCSGG